MPVEDGQCLDVESGLVMLPGVYIYIPCLDPMGTGRYYPPELLISISEVKECTKEGGMSRWPMT